MTINRLILIGAAFLLLCLSFVSEFDNVRGELIPLQVVYDKILGRLRGVDLIVIGCIILLFINKKSGNARTSLANGIHSLIAPGLLFCAAIVASLYLGQRSGAENLFFDWRALALGVLLYCGLVGSIRGERDARTLIKLHTSILLIAALFYLGRFFLGGGVLVEESGGLVTVFDGPIVDALLLQALYSSARGMSARGSSAIVPYLWAGSTITCVILSLRRSLYVALFVGVVTVVGASLPTIRARSARMALLAVFGGATTVAALIFGGDRIVQRTMSMNLLSPERSVYSSTNNDHIGELLDAWDAIQEGPIVGIGLGNRFASNRIASWKRESAIVHNAILHVWLFYGFLGLISYLLFHYRLFRLVGRLVTSIPSGHSRAYAAAVLGWMMGRFVSSLFFAVWPYGFLQTMIHYALAVSIICARRERRVRPPMLGVFGDAGARVVGLVQ